MSLTKKQHALLRRIEGFAILGQTPTRNELARVSGVSSPAITKMLKHLENKGYVKINRGWRSIEILKTGDNDE
tara:strand:+ start:110 stop:328 length:219 start_codon:yes stop_codon:yes gene_type:complete